MDRYVAACRVGEGGDMRRILTMGDVEAAIAGGSIFAAG
jgi:hypothetical protein